jgi:hypothetical protein
MSSRALRMVSMANGENPQSSPMRDTRPIMERLMFVTPTKQKTVPRNILHRPVRSRRSINLDLDAARSEIVLVSPPDADDE